MSPGPRMFRERALRRISSPEQLDRLVQVTSPRRWIGLGALLVVAVGVIVWSAVASVPTTLSGPGFLLPLGGLREVQAPTSGTVATLDLAIGQHIVAGQSVGSVSGPDGGAVTVRAPETGVVSETDTVRNAFVEAGERLGLVEPIGWPLVLYSYVPANVAADLAPGTPVHVTFGAGIGSTFGYARARVQSVSQFPVTPERLAFILQDSSVINQVEALGASNEVLIELDLSARTPSGLAWGSGSGPPGRLPAGLPAKVEFIVGSHHPIDNLL
jgi:hypothetical protein